MRDAANKTFWQKWAKWYAPAMRSSEEMYRSIRERIAPCLTKRMNVLELACGTGQLSFGLAPCARQWEATDFSEAMIAQAKRYQLHGAGAPGSRLFFSVQDATNLPYADHSFDAVVIANALHIMPHPETALAEIRRVLKPGGMLFAPTFVHGTARAARLRVRLMSLAGFHVFHRWSAGEFVDYLNAHGFRVAEQCLMGSAVAPLCFVRAVPQN